MNINIFFLLVSSVLLMILFIFKPLNIKQQNFDDVPLFNISAFTIYELNTKGLITFMSGSEATRYSDRYSIENIDYTDNSKKYLANMKANTAVFRDDVVDLSGDVVYFREDGLTFETQDARYNKKTSVASADGKYLLYRDRDKATGTHLRYNNEQDTVESKNITVTYQIKKSNK